MEDSLFTSEISPSLFPSNPNPSSICEANWGIAEETTQEVVCCIHPTLDSEEKRKDVIEYVQRLIRCSLGCEVFPYGSVPLKTYLPDGDIDLTALSSPTIEESLARDVLAVLQREEQNENAEYELKDTQFIDAEVKLVKCLVQNIVIDISFNQLGGLCTLCFLEQVDRVVGKDHLFKCSIILIKAWCYYESRILGAHHGLISTYALETLVLYIFHLFNSSLTGPLAVLYRFLDYFSNFDWDNYCVSLSGPVCKSTLPDIVVEKPENGGDDLMLSEEFLRNCVDMFSVPSRGLETNVRAFPQKHLNIIDPLKENNNLGRSVHKGNFYRIRSAFKYGARKLGRILMLPRERIADEIKKFFANTLERHGQKYGADIPNAALIVGAKGFGTFSSASHMEAFLEDDLHLKSSNVDFDDDMLGVEDKFTLGFRNEIDRWSMKGGSSQKASETSCSIDGVAVSGNRLAGDANDLATFRSMSFRSVNETSGFSPPSSNFSSSLSGQFHHAPHLQFSRSSTENGDFGNGNLCYSNPSQSADNRMGLDSCLHPREDHLLAGNTAFFCTSHHEGVSSRDSAISSPDANISQSLSLDFRERSLVRIIGEGETLNPLSDLSGDYDSHIRSLLYGQSCHGHALSAPVVRSSPTSPSQLRNKKPWDTVRRSMPLKQDSCFQMKTNSVILGPHLYAANNSTPSSAAFGSEDGHKARGTGTYFPNTNFCSCSERPSQGRGKNQASGTCRLLQRHAHNNGFVPYSAETNSFEGGSHELSNADSQVQDHQKSGLSRQSHSSMLGNSHANGFSNSYGRLEFGSLGHLSEGNNSQLASGTCNARSSTSSLAALEMQSSKPVLGRKQERIADKSFHLKNEDDFPPLSA